MAKPGRKPKLTVVGGAGTGSLSHEPKNSLNEDEVHALTLRHKSKYESALASKKKAAAEFLNCTKLIKADLGDDGLADIKDMIAADGDGFEAKLQAELERKARLARWLGLDVGSQGSLFDGGGTAPSQQERGHALGKREALEGKPCKTDFAPGTEGYDGYMEGWHAGAAIKANMDQEQEEGAALLLRPQSNEPAGTDAFDSAADDIPDIPPAPEIEPWADEAAVVAEAPSEPPPANVDTVLAAEGTPPEEAWPDDAAVEAREPAEAL